MAMNPLRKRLVTFNTHAIRRKNLIAERKARREVAKEIEDKLKAKIDKPYPPASRPGQPPRRRTGTLHGSVEVFVQGKAIKLRAVQYGIWLDGGTQKILPRPWIRKNIHDKAKYWNSRIAYHYRRFNK